VSVEAQRAYLSGKVGNTDLGIPVALPNLEFQIPVSDPYGEFHIVGGVPPVAMGGEGEGKVRNAYVGFVQLTVWVPATKGIKPATTAGDKFKDLFAQKVGRDLAGQVYRFGAMQEITPTGKAGWECCVYRVPYRREVVEDIQVSI
jgi:hypothetical protein